MIIRYKRRRGQLVLLFGIYLLVRMSNQLQDILIFVRKEEILSYEYRQREPEGALDHTKVDRIWHSGRSDTAGKIENARDIGRFWDYGYLQSVSVSKRASDES
jgi:hypothetical protein